MLTIDFETYWADKYTLSGMTTEEYLRDSRFEVIGVAVQVDDGKPQWFSGTHKETRKWLMQFDWKNNPMLAHNTMFDGAILKWHFGISPRIYLDTLCMARAIHGVDAGGSLAALTERYQIGKKGTEVIDAKNKNRCQFSAEDLARYGAYCVNDVALTYTLFSLMAKNFPMEELKLIDMTLRMFIQPTLCVDSDSLQARLSEMASERTQLLGTLKESLKCETEEEVRVKLASNAKFAKVLEQFNIEVPKKISERTGKSTFALAKKDEGFIALTEHDDTFIQHLCAVRLGTKSTLEEKRIQRFMDIGERNGGNIPIPLKYYGAHTGRWSGTDKVNFQNLPSRDPKKKALKKAIVPPEGFRIINSDSSQIEARVLAWLAGQQDVVDQFASGQDVYSLFASSVYERTITKADAVERFVGKTCILGLGYGTGASKLQHTLKTSPPGADLTEDKCKEIVNLYRDTNDMIVKLWRDGDDALKRLADWQPKQKPFAYGKHKCVRVTKEGIELPNGLYIRYPDLQITDDSKGGYQYKSRKGPVSLWGGSVVENVVQALARIIVGQQMIKLTERYRPVLTVHDAAVCVVPEDEVDEACAWIVEVMSTPPNWAKGLPVACEAHFGKNYGEMEEWKA